MNREARLWEELRLPWKKGGYILDLACEIARLAAEQGGRAYYVGGFVRDKLLGIDSKDMDIEVHGVTPPQLEDILNRLGEWTAVGKSFGIYKLKGTELDVAMPRKEKQTGAGHRGFAVEIDPFLGTKKAAMRRDFTVNAMMQDVLTGEIVDHFGGLSDLRKKVIRHVDEKTFGEDPLRVLRAAQFAARFQFTVAEETERLSSAIDLSGLSGQRVMEEMKKALLKAPKPSAFFRELSRMDQLEPWFPELKKLMGVPQNPVHHPEGDVWEHTMLVLDAGAQYRRQVKEPLAFMLSALAHDLGKPETTETIRGVIHSYGHQIRGVEIGGVFLRRLTNEKRLIHYVQNMIEHHMEPNLMAADHSSVKATNKMFDRSVDPETLLFLAACDSAGKGGADDGKGQAFLWERLAVYREYMTRPYVTGADLMNAGLSPGGNFSQLLEFAHKLRLAGVSKESALRQTLAYSRREKKAEK